MAKKKKPDEVRLDEVQKFYVRGNLSMMDDERIASHLDVPIQVVRDYRATQQANESQFVRSVQVGKGVTAMTQEGSEMSDDVRSRAGATISDADIQRAIDARDYKRAEALEKARDEGRLDAEAARRLRYSDRFHFLR